MAPIYVNGPCAACHQRFQLHPWHVPVVLDEGLRKPLCAACVALVNPARIRNGLDPIVPHPRAYAPVDESEWSCE